MKTITITVEEFTKLIDERLEKALSNQSKKGIHDDPFANGPEVCSRKDLSELLGITIGTIDAWSRSGLLPKHNAGRRVYFLKHEVIEFLKSRSLHHV